MIRKTHKISRSQTGNLEIQTKIIGVLSENQGVEVNQSCNFRRKSERMKENFGRHNPKGNSKYLMIKRKEIREKENMRIVNNTLNISQKPKCKISLQKESTELIERAGLIELPILSTKSILCPKDLNKKIENAQNNFTFGRSSPLLVAKSENIKFSSSQTPILRNQKTVLQKDNPYMPKFLHKKDTHSLSNTQITPQSQPQTHTHESSTTTPTHSTLPQCSPTATQPPTKQNTQTQHSQAQEHSCLQAQQKHQKHETQETHELQTAPVQDTKPAPVQMITSIPKPLSERIQLTPPSLNNSSIIHRKHLSMRRWHCISRPQLSKSCGISSLLSCWNYLYSTLGNGTLPPVTQEQALKILGFSPPWSNIAFGLFTGNRTLLRWFHVLNKYFGVKGTSSTYLKFYGKNKMEQNVQKFEKDLRRDDIAFIYHCYNHYFCPIGYEITPEDPAFAFSTLEEVSQSPTEHWIIIGMWLFI